MYEKRRHKLGDCEQKVSHLKCIGFCHIAAPSSFQGLNFNETFWHFDPTCAVTMSNNLKGVQSETSLYRLNSAVNFSNPELFMRLFHDLSTNVKCLVYGVPSFLNLMRFLHVNEDTFKDNFDTFPSETRLKPLQSYMPGKAMS